eukprot:1043098-Rhodomonas_salina.1
MARAGGVQPEHARHYPRRLGRQPLVHNLRQVLHEPGRPVGGASLPLRFKLYGASQFTVGAGCDVRAVCRATMTAGAKTLQFSSLTCKPFRGPRLSRHSCHQPNAIFGCMSRLSWIEGEEIGR